MSKEIPDQKTPITKEQAVEALWNGYLTYFASAPKPECIEIITAQWGIETGWGASMHGFNFGNVKSRDGDGFDYQYFECNELLPKAMADGYCSRDPDHTRIQSYRPDGNAWIWFYPPHPGCRFRAFDSLQAGGSDHISLLAKHFPSALQAARTGDPALYAHALKMSGYYTADESSYSKGLVGCVRIVQGLPINFDQLPIMTDAQREQIEGWLAVGVDLMLQDALDASEKARKEANTEK